MTIYTLSHGPLKLDVSDQGGVIEGFWRDTTPLLRPGKKSGVATDASCFPLVPFANRVSGNRFVWQGREYQLQPNVEWDAHYLHGDAWLGQWQCVSRSEDSLCLVYEHRSGVYHYRVSQAFHLTPLRRGGKLPFTAFHRRALGQFMAAFLPGTTEQAKEIGRASCRERV